MKDPLRIHLKDAEITASCGQSLASSLYAVPVDIVLSGPVGAGKTTFVQGLAKGLGITEPVLSPTYALEQRYETNKGYPFLHLDLYRIADHRIAETLAHSDAHEGIRCIEWADRMKEEDDAGHGRISIALDEEADGRSCSIVFDDAAMPTREQIEVWRTEVKLPSHVAAHCDAVAAFAVRCGHALIERGMIVRPLLLQRAGEVHDLFRFVDFRAEGAPQGYADDAESIDTWNKWKDTYSGMKHEAACAAFLREKQLPALATVVEAHGLHWKVDERAAIEQQLLYYADKRIKIDTVVTLEERFADFAERYGHGTVSEEAKRWYNDAKKTEELLFPNGPL